MLPILLTYFKFELTLIINLKINWTVFSAAWLSWKFPKIRLETTIVPTLSMTGTTGEKEKMKPRFQSFCLIFSALSSVSSPVAIWLSVYDCLSVQTLIIPHFLFNLLTPSARTVFLSTSVWCLINWDCWED